MDEFCGSPFWDKSLSTNTSDPDLSSCFQKTVFQWLPCGYLFIVGVYQFIHLWGPGRLSISHNWFNITKTVLCSILALIWLCDLFEAVHRYAQQEEVFSVEFVSPTILFLALVVAVLLIQYERSKGVEASGYLFIFWFLLFLVSLFFLQSVSRAAVRQGRVDDVYRLVLLCIHLPLVVVQLVLSACVDKQPDGTPETPGELKPCPERNSSFLSRITFWWFTGMVIKGYKKALERKDLWALNPQDTSNKVYPVLQKHWEKQLKKCKRSSSTRQKKSKDSIPLKDVKPAENADQPLVEVQDGKTSSSPSLTLTLIKTYGITFLAASFFKLIHDCLMFASPQLLKLLIEYTKDKTIYTWRGYLYAVLMFVVALSQSLVLHQYFQKCMVTGMRIRTSLIAAIFRKSLILSNSARKSSTVGEIVNLMSVDAQRFVDLTTYLCMLWSAPLQIMVALYFLWETLSGGAVMAGLGVMILMIPINAVIANKNKNLQAEQMGYKDNRIKLMNEILNGIKVLKLYAWEPSFREKVLGIRNQELTVLKKSAYLNAAATFTWSCSPFLVSLTSFAVFIYSDENNVLDAKRAFVALSLFNILRFPLMMLPQTISSLVQASVSINRLTNFLSHDEIDKDIVDRDVNVSVPIIIENGSFCWGKDEAPVLDNINLTVNDSSLVAVVGSVGSGKSSLLSALLGEMEKSNGRVNVKGTVAYVSQLAWIQNASLRDNILFGKEMHEGKYWRVVEACALKPDLEMLPAGDETEIGEKGINLSGGQKQRISLARAVYNGANIYMLDDPLSAVDSHVGKHIFDNVIGPQGLLQNKTRILVTHGLSFLPKVDNIVVLSDGMISETGTFQELLSHRGAFAEFLKTYLTEESDDVLEELDEEIDLTDVQGRSIREEILSQVSELTHEDINELRKKKSCEQKKEGRERKDTEKSCGDGEISNQLQRYSSTYLEVSKSRDQISTIDDTEMECLQRQISQFDEMRAPPPIRATSRIDGEDDMKERAKVSEKDKLIETETSETGRVKLSVFVAYLRAVGIPVSVLIIFLYILNNGCSIYANVWLSEWSDDPLINGSVDPAQRDMRLGVYGALGFAQGILEVSSAFSVAMGGLSASRHLHRVLVVNLMHCAMSFYEATPIGRLMNRFSEDLLIVDLVMHFTMRSMINCVLSGVASFTVIISTTPLFASVILPLALVYISIQRFYVATSRQLKRLESVSRSPIYSHFGETIQGVSTIRAYQQQERFIDESDQRVDNNQMCYYPNIISNRWLAIRLEFVGNCIVLFAALFAVVGRDTLSDGIVGLSITYALSVTQILNWMVRMTSELETNIVAVERVKEYSETPTEADWINPDNRPEPDWPSKGNIEFDNYCVRYREGLDLVLKGITAKVNGGEKIGIVGRTGAGKSSLTLALFRILEAADGAIKIDDVNIASIGLHDLRSKLTIIPQDPVLFSGSLRMNLDPFEKHSDDEIWKALEMSFLKNYVSGLSEGLQYECSEGGENLSVGQRQLICLARALLRKTKVLILDEATAAVDMETDNWIQSTIRSAFDDCTILTIAHRINTILDYTRVMVLDAGEITEFAPPQELLQDRNSIFYRMAKDAGLVAGDVESRI